MGYEAVWTMKVCMRLARSAFLCPAVFSLCLSCGKTAEAPASSPQKPSTVTRIVERTVDPFQQLGKPEDLDKQFSYAYGNLLYKALTERGLSGLDAQYFAKGVLDASEGSSLYTDEEMADILRQMQDKLLEQAEDEYAEQSAENKSESEAFFAENGEEEDVVTAENGVQYRILEPGETDKPLISEDDTVTVDYKVTELDGTVLIDSYSRSRSDTFLVKDIGYPLLIRALCMLHPGSHCIFWVPYEIASSAGVIDSLKPEMAVVVEVTVRSVTYN